MTAKKHSDEQRIYFLLGDEYTQKQEYIHSLVAACPGVSPEFGIFKADLKSDSLSETLSRARNLPLCSEKQLFIVTVPKKFTRQEKEQVVEYCVAAPSFSVLIFDCLQRDKLPTALEKNAAVVVYDSDREECPLEEVVQRRIQVRGKTIAADARAELIRRIGDDRDELLHAVEYLLLYVGTRGTITRQDVTALVAESLAYGDFDLVNALVSRDFNRALAIFRDMTETGSSVQEIMGVVLWQLKRIYRAQRMMMRQVPKQEIARALRIGPSFITAFLHNIKKFPYEHIIRAITQLAELDNAVKTGRVDEEAGLEAFFVRLTTVHSG